MLVWTCAAQVRTMCQRIHRIRNANAVPGTDAIASQEPGKQNTNNSKENRLLFRTS